MKHRPFRLLRWMCGLLVATLLLGIDVTGIKAEVYWPEGPSIQTPSAIVMEVNSGAILYEKNAHEENYPASITKILTTLVALEQCELDEVVIFSKDAVFKNEGDTSHIARDVDEEMTMEESLYAVMLESANECAYAVAEHVGKKLGGDYSTFIELMNKKAKELGCKNSQFQNCNGLPDEKHWTSAYDMALIAAEAYKNETFRYIVSSKRYVIPPTNKHSESTYLNNHHAMLHAHRTNKYLYEYSKGGKTGYTKAAGSTLVSYAEHNGMTLVCVVMHTDNRSQYIDTRALFDYCFNSFKVQSIVEQETALSSELKSKGVMNTYGSYLSLDETSAIVLPISANFSDVSKKVIDDPDGDVVARIEYSYGDKKVGYVNIVPSDIHLGETIFDYATEIEQKEGKIIRIKPFYCLLAVILIVAILVALKYFRKLYENFYYILHELKSKRIQKDRFRPKKKRKRRKRDRMFR